MRGAVGRLGLYGLIVAALALGGAGLYFWGRPETTQDHRAVVASAPQAQSASGQTRSFPLQPAAIAADEAAKAHKHPRREAPALGQDAPAVDRWFMEAYLRCWSPPAKIPTDGGYAAKIRVQHTVTGALAAAPVLVNPPSDPDWRSYADSAVQAVKKCNPLAVPTEYVPRFDRWRKLTLYFSPDSARE